MIIDGSRINTISWSSSINFLMSWYFNRYEISILTVHSNRNIFSRLGKWLSLLFGYMCVSVYILSAYYYNNHFTAPWIASGITRVSRYQKGKTRKVKPIWIYCSKR